MGARVNKLRPGARWKLMKVSLFIKNTDKKLNSTVTKMALLSAPRRKLKENSPVVEEVFSFLPPSPVSRDEFLDGQ